MFTFRRRYFFLALFLFIIEVWIALYVKDRFVRPYVGDFLVVILLYCAARSVLLSSARNTAVGVLLFAYLVEWLQYMNLVSLLGLQNNRLANVVIGNHFEWVDMLAYTLGIATVLLLDRKPLTAQKKGYA